MNTGVPVPIKKLFNFCLLCVLFFNSCQTNKTHDIGDRYVKIAFLPKGLNPDMAISNCNDIFSHSELLRDTIITDNLFVNKFIACINELQKSPVAYNTDFRIICILNTGEDKIIRVCLGEDNYTMLNDTLMKDSKELFKLIDNTIYLKKISYPPETSPSPR